MHFVRTLTTGLLAALPLAATVAIVWWLFELLLRWLGPSSRVGGWLVAIGLGVTGSEVAGYALGIVLVLAALFGLGLLVETGLQRGLARLLNAIVSRIPLVRSVYELARKVVGLLRQGDETGHKSMSAVWCYFGGVPGEGEPGRAAVLALLSTPQPVTIDGRSYLGVIVPTAPVPVGGGLLYLPQEWVRPADVGIEALTSIYVSLGMTSAQYLGTGKAPPAAPSTAGRA